MKILIRQTLAILAVMPSWVVVDEILTQGLLGGYTEHRGRP